MPDTPAIPATLDPERLYRVEIARAVAVAGIKLRPRGEIILRGDLLARLIEEAPDVVLAAVAV